MSADVDAAREALYYGPATGRRERIAAFEAAIRADALDVTYKVAAQWNHSLGCSWEMRSAPCSCGLQSFRARLAEAGR